jgi:hypothetical protein
LAHFPYELAYYSFQMLNTGFELYNFTFQGCHAVPLLQRG